MHLTNVTLNRSANPVEEARRFSLAGCLIAVWQRNVFSDSLYKHMLIAGLFGFGLDTQVIRPEPEFHFLMLDCLKKLPVLVWNLRPNWPKIRL